jgi:hypothetical protein
MEFYSAIKKNEILLFAGKRIEPENITSGEVARFGKPKATCFFLSYLKYKPNTNTSNIMKNRLH